MFLFIFIYLYYFHLIDVFVQFFKIVAVFQGLELSPAIVKSLVMAFSVYFFVRNIFISYLISCFVRSLSTVASFFQDWESLQWWSGFDLLQPVIPTRQGINILGGVQPAARPKGLGRTVNTILIYFDWKWDRIASMHPWGCVLHEYYQNHEKILNLNFKIHRVWPVIHSWIEWNTPFGTEKHTTTNTSMPTEFPAYSFLQ